MLHSLMRRSLVGGLLFTLAAAAPAASELLTPGTVFRDCPECPELVVVPAGRFVLGHGGLTASEGPAREVVLARPFAIGRYEITFDEWEACVAAGGCQRVPNDHQWGRGRRPVINVTFAEVQAYVDWLASKTGHRYRLPSEAEWAYANRAGSTTAFWWGDEAGAGRANCRDCGSEWSAVGTAPVGSFPANFFGLHDTTGNVLEWVQDCWYPDHTGAPGDGSSRDSDDCRQRVVRGGSWYYVKNTARSAWRSRNDVRVHSYSVGFRVVRDLP